MMRGNGRTAGAPADQVYSVHATDKPAPLVDRRHVLDAYADQLDRYLLVTDAAVRVR